MDPLEIFRERLPHRPYCTDDLSTGLRIRSRDRALRCRYLQPNPPALLCWLVFDIDRPGGVLAWEDANVTAPNFTIRTPHNQHGQLFYGVQTPVCTSEAARLGPLRFAAAIQRAYTDLLGADRSYSGLIAKNPFHPDWETVGWVGKLYELSDLAGWVEGLEEYTPTPEPVDREAWGLGRNCTLFARLGPEGKWAYREIRDYWGGPWSAWEARVLSQALEWNGEFRDPLGYNEVRYLARSVARFTWQQFTPAGFQDLVARTHTPKLQAARGRRSGQVRAQELEHRRALARELQGQGRSEQEMARIMGVSVYAVSKYLYR